MAPKDSLYMTGNDIDNVYIVKTGLLYTDQYICIDYANIWPCVDEEKGKAWTKREVTKDFKYTTYYKPGDIIGYYDLI